MRICLLILTLSFLGTATAGAQEESEAACGTDSYRQFDFWVGDWTVSTPDGELAGHNRIEPILGGCALQEHWVGRQGGRGTSFNFFDAARGHWHQTWIDAGGTVLLLDGGLNDAGHMVLRGEGVSDGAPVLHEIAWQPAGDGAVRQLWRSSKDGGASWNVVFDGRYRKTQ